MIDTCPACSSEGKVVTAVAIPNLGRNPRRVLVTRQCSAARCLLKYPVLKSEPDLTAEEQGAWHNR